MGLSNGGQGLIFSHQAIRQNVGQSSGIDFAIGRGPIFQLGIIIEVIYFVSAQFIYRNLLVNTFCEN